MQQLHMLGALAYGGGVTVPWPPSDPKNKKNL